VRRPVRGIAGLGYLPACQQLIADQSAQFLSRIATPLWIVHIVAECPPAIRLPVIAWVPWVQRIIAELPTVEFRQSYVRQDVPGIGQVSRAWGKICVPRRPSSLVMALRLLPTVVRVLSTGILLGRRADRAIALGA